MPVSSGLPNRELEGTAHEPCTLEFSVRGEPLGSAPIDPGSAERLGWRRTGIAYFCPECGDIWARVSLRDSRGAYRHWDVAIVGCEAHGDLWEVPGSLLSGYRNAGYLEYLPEPALRREFEVHLRQEKRQL